VSALAVVLCGLSACEPSQPLLGRQVRALSAICSVEVIKDGASLGVKDVEKDYLPNVVNCESGDLHPEALKTQAVASRTYVYYKLASGGTAITSGTSVQVYDCPRKIYLGQKHYDAVNATAGQILTYMGKPIWPCFNAGVSPTNPPCTAKTGVGADTCCTNNAGKSGAGITQSPCGYVDPKNYLNRGCMCQNGADCYAKTGKLYVEIIKAYFGDDIQLETATGSCISPAKDSGPKPRDGARAEGAQPGSEGRGAGDALPPARDRAASDAGPRVEDSGCSCALSVAAPISAGACFGLALLVIGLVVARSTRRGAAARGAARPRVGSPGAAPRRAVPPAGRGSSRGLSRRAGRR
jgi:hypothetical protein